MKKILTDAANIGAVTARTMAFRMRDKGVLLSEQHLAAAVLRRLQVRGLAGRQQPGRLDPFYYFATGVTPAMEMKMVGHGSQYPWTAQDAKGNPFDGAKTYKIHLPPNVPSRISGLSSCTTTRRGRCFRPIRPRRASAVRAKDVKANATVQSMFFGPEAPGGMEGNWVQTFLARAGS